MIDRLFGWYIEMRERLHNPTLLYEPIHKHAIPLWQAYAILCKACELLQSGVSFEAIYIALSRDAPRYQQEDDERARESYRTKVGRIAVESEQAAERKIKATARYIGE